MAFGLYYASNGNPLQAFMWGNNNQMCTGEFTLVGRTWAPGPDWRQGGRQEAGAMARFREDKHWESDDGMTAEHGLRRPPLSTLEALFSVPKPTQESSQSLILPGSLGKPVHPDLEEQLALQISPLLLPPVSQQCCHVNPIIPYLTAKRPVLVVILALGGFR